MNETALEAPAVAHTDDDLVRRLADRGLVTDPDSARGKLLRAATDLFRRQGYERTTVRDLARAIGIQSGSIFHHFRSKPEILHAVVEETIRITIARLEAALDGATGGRGRLRAIVRAELEGINGEGSSALKVTVFEWRCLPEESQQQLLALRAEYDRIWLDNLAAARTELPADDIFVLRRLLMGAISWTWTWYRPDGRLDLDGLADHVLRLVLHD